MFVKHQRLRTQYQSTTHQLLIHHPFTGTFTGTKNITNSIDSSPHLRRAGPCVRLTALTSLRQPNARAATVCFMGRSVPPPVARGGDDYTLVPPAAPASSTDRLSISFSLNPPAHPTYI
jgi:hypothetical protein